MCKFLSEKMAGRCSARLGLGLNLLASVLMLIQIALRFYYLSLSYDSRAAFFIVLAVYQVLLIGLLVAAEFKLQRARIYFDNLDS